MAIAAAVLPLGAGITSTASAEPEPTFTVDVPHENLATHEERQAAGYYYGPEGVLGVVPGVTADAVTPGTDTTRTDLYTWIGSNGIPTEYGFAGRGGRFTGTLAKPFLTEPRTGPDGRESDDNIRMANTPSDILFTAPSKIYEVPGTTTTTTSPAIRKNGKPDRTETTTTTTTTPGYWLTVVHSERYYSSPATGTHQGNGYYATLGMAKSTDRGASWTYLGEVIRHKTTMAECAAAGNLSAETGSGPWMIVNDGGVDYFYMYYMDKQTPSCGFLRGTEHMTFALARAKVSDVVAASANGTVTPWVKYHNGWGSEPGIGGRASDLAGAPEVQWEPAWFDVSYNTHLGKYMVISTGCHPKGATYSGDLCYRGSSDGITWSQPITLTNFGIGYNIYPTIVGLGDVPGQVTGKEFYIYYLHTWALATIWVEGSLWRAKVTIN